MFFTSVICINNLVYICKVNDKCKYYWLSNVYIISLILIYKYNFIGYFCKNCV